MYYGPQTKDNSLSNIYGFPYTIYQYKVENLLFRSTNTSRNTQLLRNMVRYVNGNPIMKSDFGIVLYKIKDNKNKQKRTLLSMMSQNLL